MTIALHGYEWSVPFRKYKGNAVVAWPEKVTIEDNVFIGVDSIILKGVRIGRNTIIGAGSVVSSSIPPNSVAAGNPCKVVMSLDEYHEKTKRMLKEKAKEYALEQYQRTKKMPEEKIFWKEFAKSLEDDGSIDRGYREMFFEPALTKLIGDKALYGSFGEFLAEAGILKQ